MNERTGDHSGMGEVDLDRIRIGLDGVNLSAERVSRTLVRAFASAAVSGRSFEQTLKSIAASLAQMALSAGLKPLQSGLSSLIGSMLSSIGGAAGMRVTPFADGGVVSRPTFFAADGGLGLMGERGAEAIMPLARGPDGKLGLAMQGGGRKPVEVHVHIATPNPESFRQSQVQIAGALARAVARGGRGL